MNKLASILDVGNTPVIISDNVEWVSNIEASTQTTELSTLNKALEKWQQDWVSQNTDKYLSHYSNQFFYSDGTLSEWADHKRRVQAGKPKVAIKISDVSMFGYPNLRKSNNLSPNTKIIVVDFDQYYESPTLKNKMRKRQYWTNENNQWKIIYEGAA